ncbi:hypothetical protein [Candidatus Methanodesulfokora washburnensis]|jgi:uncharacterized protein YjcR|nr:hypothetical protein [Candidatus Methanodesulfokores washburnensis]
MTRNALDRTMYQKKLRDFKMDEINIYEVLIRNRRMLEEYIIGEIRSI